MFEYYGWAAVIQSLEESEHESIGEIIDALKDRMAALRLGDGTRDLRVVNGLHQVSLAGFANHKGVAGEELLSFYRALGDLAPGSYGILYTRDDEDKAGPANRFCVHVLSRGELEEQNDPFLSPIVPVIEDPPT